ncbi:virB8 family protein [Campylobacter fetus]|uniref:virB8 family protein n=1 Tax=Campylobacter fetus TaxID=196 RepID=UPI0003E3A295|nr:type IV secretion system protein [Campylobacter fetus]CDF65944.1 inner membrane protein forms channel for type iv secretion of t-dna complex, virb8 [Campylobacter fetus subsp. venerealis str. 84-112]
MSKEYDKQKSIEYEASIRYLVEKSNKRAWLIAFLSFIVAVLSIIAVALLTPLKSVEPYVIRVNDVTGAVDIITSVKQEDLTQNEALDKYFVSTYIKTREGYYYDLLQQDYVKTQILSSPKVAEEYTALYSGDKARNELLKNRFEVKVHINSVVLGDSAGMKTATIRFKEETIDLSSKASNMVSKIATLSYDYAPDDLVQEQERLENPLGFKVLTYRIDMEIGK